MFHPDTQFLIDRWAEHSTLSASDGLRPEVLGGRLPRAILIGDLDHGPTLQLAGSWIEDLHDRPLKGESLFRLWDERSATLVASSLLRCTRDNVPVVLTAEAGARRIRVELGLAPLRRKSGQIDRVFGLFAPASLIELGQGESPLLTARLGLCVDQPSLDGGFAYTADPRRIA